MTLKTRMHEFKAKAQKRVQKDDRGRPFITFVLTVLLLDVAISTPLSLLSSDATTFQPNNVAAITRAAKSAVENGNDKNNCTNWYINS